MSLALREIRKVLAITITAFVCAGAVGGQSGRSTAVPAKSEQATPKPCKQDKTEVSAPWNVMFNVLVTDSSGKPVQDVDRQEFRVFENDVEQQLSVFSKREGPLSYGLLVDASGSLRSQFSMVALTARAMISTNDREDEVFLTRFISSDKIDLVQDWTRDQARLIKALADAMWIAGGQSAILDAVFESARHLDAHRIDHIRRRSALVLITDGEDRASYYNLSQLLGLLRKLDIQVFVLAFTNDLQGAGAVAKAGKLLTTLAQRTGGRVVFLSSQSDVLDAVNVMRKELSAQYSIGYEPTNQTRDNLTRKIRVEISDKPNRDRRLAVTRADYIALCQ